MTINDDFSLTGASLLGAERAARSHLLFELSRGDDFSPLRSWSFTSFDGFHRTNAHAAQFYGGSLVWYVGEHFRSGCAGQLTRRTKWACFLSL
jgi:hypothetical protein